MNQSQTREPGDPWPRWSPSGVNLILDGAGIIRSWSDTAQRIFGFNRSEILGYSVTRILPNWTAGGMERDLPLEVEGLTRAGERIRLQATTSRGHIGEQVFYNLLLYDLEAERISRERAFLQDRLAAVGQLAAGIAHDFNNLLGTIILYCEMMLEMGDLPEEVRKRIQIVHDQANRGARLTNQVLDFSRRSIMEMRTLNLVAFLEEMEGLLDSTLPESIEVLQECELEEAYMQADPLRLQQAIVNLALNARDAMPRGGKLTFKLESLQVEPGEPPYRDMAPGKWLRLQVVDTGVGIPKEVLPHLFEPFFTTKPPGEGTGLGLAQVYGIVKSHYGYIDVVSTTGEGATFTLYLPALEEVVPAEEPARKTTAVRGDGETLLIVEDDEATRGAIEDIARGLGYHVLAVGTAEEALELLEAGKPEVEVVLCDMVLPFMSGRDLYDRLQEREGSPPVVFMTGYPLKEGTQELLDRRQVGWLQKPFDSSRLAAALREALEGIDS